MGAVEPAQENAHYFAAPLAMRDECIRLGKDAIKVCGCASIDAYSDSDRTVRSIARKMGVREKPISDWFHLAMRIRHVESVAEALEAPTAAIARANDAVRKSPVENCY